MMIPSHNQDVERQTEKSGGYPCVAVDLDVIAANATRLVSMCGEWNVSVAGVTKACCGCPLVGRAMLEGGVKQLADSRLRNLARLRDNGINAELMLLRIPMLSEVEDVVRLADISLNSEYDVVAALSREAERQGRKHGVVLMIDVGDLREGLLPNDAIGVAESVLDLPGVKLAGLGTNLTCYGGVAPSVENLTVLARLAEEVERRAGFKLDIVSGGNSSSLSILLNGEAPPRINHLRLGESILLGLETLRREPLPGLNQHAFEVRAEIIELKTKDSVPHGMIAQDAFGNSPSFIDRGNRRRAIVGLGREDAVLEALTPLDAGIEILGGSSDHMILDVEERAETSRVGDVLRFSPGYGALLALMTSQYVEKRHHAEAMTAVKPFQLTIMGVPSNLGSGHEGVENGPEALRKASLVKTLRGHSIDAVDGGDVRPAEKSPEENGVKNLSAVAATCESVAEAVARRIDENRRIVVLGGDHSVSIGVLAGVRKVFKDVGMIYFDAHGDFNTERTSPSGRPHGMVVSSCVGLGPEPLVNCAFPGAKVGQEDTVVIGLRDVDPEERKNLRDSRIHTFTMEEVDLVGMRTVMERALRALAHCRDGVFVSFDFDVMDSLEAPGVSLPVRGGLNYREAHLAMEMIQRSGMPIFADFVELNPLRDDGSTAELGVNLIATLFGKRVL